MEILGNIPLDPLITEDCDCGKPVVLSRVDSQQVNLQFLIRNLQNNAYKFFFSSNSKYFIFSII